MFVPQSNSLPALIETMDLLARGAASLADLAATRETTTRTARYYVDFATWVNWAKVEDATIELTRQGWDFAQNVERRASIYESSLANTELVRAIHKAQRAHRREHKERLGHRDACVAVLAERDLFAASTRARRAGAVANLLDALHAPERYDWSTGELAETGDEPVELDLTFSPRSFLSEIASRRFGQGLRHRIGLPTQVLLAARGEHGSLEASRWGQASWAADDGPPGTRWFGALPITPQTRPLIARRSRSLRALLTTTVPHVAMLAGLLTHEDETIHVTRDMWGVRLAHGSRDLGALSDALRAFARVLALDLTEGAPWTHRREEDGAADVAELVELLVEIGALDPGDTSIVATDEWLDELDPESTLGARLEPLRDEVEMLLRRLARGAKRRRIKRS